MHTAAEATTTTTTTITTFDFCLNIFS